MKCSIQIFTFLICGIIISSCSVAQDAIKNKSGQYTWTLQDTEEYARNNLDSTKWSLEKLSNDLKNAQHNTSEIQLPITDYPSPVADYSGNGSAVTPLSIDIGVKTIYGYTLAHYRDKYNEHLFNDSVGQYYTFFTILYLTDEPNLNIGQNPKIISRNYPHYLFTGTQNTSLGDIDWVQMTLGNGENIAVITQRYFDLKNGRTVLIAPLKDGSIRFLQIQNSPETYTWDELANQSVSTIKKWVEGIEVNERVIDFFNQDKIIEQP